MTSKEISGQLLKEIMAGAYSEAARLPGESALAERFGVSRMTLRVALDELRHQGLIDKARAQEERGDRTRCSRL